MAKIVFKNSVGNSERQTLKSHDDALAEKDKRSLILWQNKIVCQSAFSNQNYFQREFFALMLKSHFFIADNALAE